MKKHIVLVGFMGTGKSAVSAALAERLRRSAIDTDAEIVRTAGMTIPDIFAQHGEPYFRQIESEVIRRVLAFPTPHIIATGGGAVLAAENRAEMLEKGHVVALFADPEVIIERVSMDTNRPLLSGNVRENVYRMLERRKHSYDFAPIRIDTSNLSVDEVVEAILAETSIN